MSNVNIDIDFALDNSGTDTLHDNLVQLKSMFIQSSFRKPPKIRCINNNGVSTYPFFGLNGMFYNSLVEEITNDSIDANILNHLYYGNSSGAPRGFFYGCKWLRSIPDNFMAEAIYTASNNHTGSMASSVTSMVNFYYQCQSLKKIIGCPFDAHQNGSKITSNTFNGAFTQLFSLHRLTFYMPNNQVGVMNATSQVIDLSQYVGWGYSSSSSSTLNDRISNLIIIDDSNDDPTDTATINKMLNENSIMLSLTGSQGFATYNRVSAVETINSLPDTSAAGGGNTIKFKDYAGSAYGTTYDMHELTAAEIAVATAKGWTVTLV